MGFREQPVPGRDGTQDHEERQTDGHAMDCGQDHTALCRVRLGIFLVGYVREGEKKRRERETEGEEENWGEAEAASWSGRQKRKGHGLSLKDTGQTTICLPF